MVLIPYPGPSPEYVRYRNWMQLSRFTVGLLVCLSVNKVMNGIFDTEDYPVFLQCWFGLENLLCWLIRFVFQVRHEVFFRTCSGPRIFP